jgi:hypothetical protein
MMAVVLLAATELIAEFCERMQAKWPERTIRLAYAGGATGARRPQALNPPMLNGSSLNERCAK